MLVYFTICAASAGNLLELTISFLPHSQACSELRKRWVDWSEDADCPFEKSDLKSFSVGQIIEFLAQLLEEEPLR